MYPEELKSTGYATDPVAVERPTMTEQVYRLQAQVQELQKELAETNAELKMQASRLSWAENELGR